MRPVFARNWPANEKARQRSLTGLRRRGVSESTFDERKRSHLPFLPPFFAKQGPKMLESLSKVPMLAAGIPILSGLPNNWKLTLLAVIGVIAAGALFAT